MITNKISQIRSRKEIRDTLSKHNLHPIFKLDSNKVTIGLDSLCLVNDGGSGSGNWGHAGVPGQLGGSAPGGGKANRIATAGGEYTSSAKLKKQLATPHKLSMNELSNLPNGTKVNFSAYGEQYNLTYNAETHQYYGSFGDFGTSCTESELSAQLSFISEGIEGKVIVPKDAKLGIDKNGKLISDESPSLSKNGESKSSISVNNPLKS